MNNTNQYPEIGLIERYLKEITLIIHAPLQERQRIAADLREHFQAALEAGESPEVIIARLGTPEEVAADFMSQMQLSYAHFMERFGAFTIDIIVFSLYWLGIILIARIFTQSTPKIGFPGVSLWELILILSILGGLGLMVLYFPILEGRFGQTYGKRVMNLRVLRDNGLPIGYKEAILRRLSFFFKIWWLDVLYVLFTEKRQRAFDIVARTIVVREAK
jgi:uncharacterized RDD family membrane protein YckC